MSYRLFLILFFGIRQFVFCQNYNVSAIPKQLLLNADAVVRLDSGFIEIPTISEKKSYYKYAITILNKNASNEENIKLYENDFTKIKNLKIKLFDKEGQLIKNAKASEIKKSSLFSSTYDVTDDKIIEFKSDVSQYPYTIEYEYNKIDNNLFGESDWYFSSNSNISVQKSIVEFRIPSDLKIQYKIFDTTIVPQKQINKNTITYQWKIENISIQKPESYIPDTCIKKMYLNLKTDHFDFGGIKAQTNSWNELGKWSYELNVGRDSLSSETVSKILALTANAKTQKEKIDVIYRYVQKKYGMKVYNWVLEGGKLFLQNM